MQNSKYYLVAFLAFLLWGFFSLALKPIAYVPSFDILFYRITFSAVLIVLFSFLFRRNVIKNDLKHFKTLNTKDKKKGILLTILGGILLGINWFLFIYVVNQVNVQSASLAYLICPIITTVLAAILLKEKLTKLKWIAVTISFFGGVIYALGNTNSLYFALLVALTYALYLVSQRSNVYFDKFNALVIQILVILILTIPYYFVNGFVIPKEVTFYINITIIALVFTVIPLYMNLYALKGASASTVGIMLYINPIVAFLLALFYYNEHINVFQFVAYFLILLSVFIFNFDIITNLTRKYIIK